MMRTPALDVRDGEETGGENHERQRSQPERKREGWE